ncbi:MAG: tRNA (adenosine(37)-N6)-threonylcarbamoyltransferase complex transferase subunit TsaD, partial [Pyrinomonadaceae bacterium]|nr:tRNA (adenosine(37)-N6)-threonylcarbamoyltransferase complex transferase subunit TsaD [Pyrinomonadaceae bacterium]
EISQQVKELAASFQTTVIKSLVGTMEKLALELKPQTLIVAGGVACNQALQNAARTSAERLKIPIYFPSKHLSTDNAAMIAAAGNFYLERGENADLSLTADVKIRLQNVDVTDEFLRQSKVRYRL